jgi:hypothetical protein
MNIQVRKATADDIPFIFNSWLKAYKHSSLFAKRIKHEVFFKYHHAVVERIIYRIPLILIATPAGDSSTILGYIVSEALDCPTIHFCYVKAPFRRFGVARQLLGATLQQLGTSQVQDFTHWTKDMDWATEKLPTLRYNPYKL